MSTINISHTVQREPSALSRTLAYTLAVKLQNSSRNRAFIRNLHRPIRNFARNYTAFGTRLWIQKFPEPRSPLVRLRSTHPISILRVRYVNKYRGDKPTRYDVQRLAPEHARENAHFGKVYRQVTKPENRPLNLYTKPDNRLTQLRYQRCSPFSTLLDSLVLSLEYREFSRFFVPWRNNWTRMASSGHVSCLM